MKYTEAYEELNALKTLGRDYNFTGVVRLDMARRLQRLTKVLAPHEDARNAWITANKLEGKNIAEMSEQQKVEYQDLMAAECNLPTKRWTADQLQLSVNQIPLDVLSVLVTEEQA